MQAKAILMMTAQAAAVVLIPMFHSSMAANLNASPTCDILKACNLFFYNVWRISHFTSSVTMAITL